MKEPLCRGRGWFPFAYRTIDYGSKRYIHYLSLGLAWSWGRSWPASPHRGAPHSPFDHPAHYAGFQPCWCRVPAAAPGAGRPRTRRRRQTPVPASRRVDDGARRSLAGSRSGPGGSSQTRSPLPAPKAPPDTAKFPGPAGRARRSRRPTGRLSPPDRAIAYSAALALVVALDPPPAGRAAASPPGRALASRSAFATESGRPCSRSRYQVTLPPPAYPAHFGPGSVWRSPSGRLLRH